jgi:fluoroquinolone transport system permease protein
MFLTLSGFELKNLVRERMTLVMIFWPLIIGSLVRLLIHQGIIDGQTATLLAVIITLLAGFAFGAMAGFSLLDDRDDQVLASIAISPVSVEMYIWFKVVFVYLMAVLAGLFMIWVSGELNMGFGQMLAVAALAALQVPAVAFLVNAFAKNKVEGFVSMKATGFILLFPLFGFYFLDAKEWFFAIAPPHWAAKAVQYTILLPAIEAGQVTMNLSFWQYWGIGVLYNLLVVAVTYRIYLGKNPASI